MPTALLTTKFPWRAVIIAVVLLLLTVFSAINLVFQVENYGVMELSASLFVVILLLYFLFIWDITIIKLKKDGVVIHRPFRLIYNKFEELYSDIIRVKYAHVIIGVPRLIFELKDKKALKIRYFQVGGMSELRRISKVLGDNNIELIIKRFGTKKS